MARTERGRGSGGREVSGYAHLLSPCQIGSMRVKNRIFMSGHMTMMVARNLVDEDQVAYYEARAEGGAGLIVTEATAVHPSGLRGGRVLAGTTEACVPGFARIVEVCAAHDCRTIGQLFHPGREVRKASDGSLPLTYSASAVPTERMRTIPAPLSEELVWEIIAGYATTARRMVDAGMDGVEVMASHGYLPVQFLSEEVNQRTDAFGGSYENRLRFLRETLAAVRGSVGSAVVGLRLSVQAGLNGMEMGEWPRAARDLAADGTVDYFSVSIGRSSERGAAVHIAAPMAIPAAYVAPVSERFKAETSLPVMATGRINQPQEAERMIALGHADMCGMTRALICDPDMPAKTERGVVDDIRACIACNQACIGHEQEGYPVSCIQFPETGRERRFRKVTCAATPRKVLVVGGGPAGMKAAAAAAQRGHEVQLFEASRRVGGQVLLAEMLPGRAEFGGLITNLEREVSGLGVEVQTNTEVDADFVARSGADVVIVATGAVRDLPDLPGGSEMPYVHAWDVISGSATLGDRVAIVDSRCDWVGIGVAEILARQGKRVTLAVTGVVPGEAIQQYVRDQGNAVLSELKVSVLNYVRAFGADDTSVYFEHVVSGRPVVLEGIDALVSVPANRSNADLARALAGSDLAVRAVGDCLAPRTAEEAVLEALVTVAELSEVAA